MRRLLDAAIAAFGRAIAGGESRWGALVHEGDITLH